MSDEHPHLWHNACKTRSEVVHLHGMSSEGNSMHSTYQEGGGGGGHARLLHPDPSKLSCWPSASSSSSAGLLHDASQIRSGIVHCMA